MNLRLGNLIESFMEMAIHMQLQESKGMLNSCSKKIVLLLDKIFSSLSSAYEKKRYTLYNKIKLAHENLQPQINKVNAAIFPLKKENEEDDLGVKELKTPVDNLVPEEPVKKESPKQEIIETPDLGNNNLNPQDSKKASAPPALDEEPVKKESPKQEIIETPNLGNNNLNPQDSKKASAPPALDVAYKMELGGEAIRLYYLIGGSQVDPVQLENIHANLDKRLEVLKIGEAERNDFNLPEDYAGYAVFVQKHDKDDPDFTIGTNPGYDAGEVFQLLEKCEIIWNSHASEHMQNFINKADVALEFTPAFNGCKQVLESLQILNAPQPPQQPEKPAAALPEPLLTPPEIKKQDDTEDKLKTLAECINLGLQDEEIITIMRSAFPKDVCLELIRQEKAKQEKKQPAILEEVKKEQIKQQIDAQEIQNEIIKGLEANVNVIKGTKSQYHQSFQGKGTSACMCMALKTACNLLDVSSFEDITSGLLDNGLDQGLGFYQEIKSQLEKGKKEGEMVKEHLEYEDLEPRLAGFETVALTDFGPFYGSIDPQQGKGRGFVELFNGMNIFPSLLVLTLSMKSISIVCKNENEFWLFDSHGAEAVKDQPDAQSFNSLKEKFAYVERLQSKQALVAALGKVYPTTTIADAENDFLGGVMNEFIAVGLKKK